MSLQFLVAILLALIALFGVALAPGPAPGREPPPCSALDPCSGPAFEKRHHHQPPDWGLGEVGPEHRVGFAVP